jgi:TPR repeat protein
MFIFILIFTSNSFETSEKTQEFPKNDLQSCLNSSSPFETSSNLQNSTILYTLFEDYFFGNPSKNISRNFSKALNFLQKSSIQSHENSIFALQVLQKDSYLTNSFPSLNSMNPMPFEAIKSIKSTSKSQSNLSTFYLSSILDCINLRKIDLTSIFLDENSTLQNFPFELGPLCTVYLKTAEAALLQAHSAKRHIDHLGVSKKVISLEKLENEEHVDLDKEKYLILNRKAFHRREHLEEILKIAQIFYFGSVPLGVPQDFEESLAFYRLGMKFGSKRATARIGKMYLQGTGVKKNVTKALIFLEKAEKQGSLEAIKTLTVLYEKGKDVKKNFSRAVELAMKGVDLGDTQSFNNLGVYMMNGMGVQNNSQEAVKYLAIAAVMGSPAAMYNMAGQYYHGKVIQKDYLKSFNLSMFTIHMAQSDDYINKAVTRYKEGDFEGAYLFYLFAAGLGYTEAYKAISYLIIKGLVKVNCKFDKDYCLKHYLTLGLSRGDSWSAVQLSKILKKEGNVFAFNVLENSPLSAEKMFYLAYAYQSGVGNLNNYTKAIETYELLIQLADMQVVDPLSKFPAYLAMWALKFSMKINGFFGGFKRF